MFSHALIKTIVRASEVLAPSLGARAAARLWFTVPPPIPRAQLLAPPRGRDAHVDAPAHGASGPGRHGRRTSTIPEIADALGAAVEAHGRPHAVIAHSLGATAAALALGRAVRPERMVLLAPVADPRRMLDVFADGLGLGPRVRARLHRAVERVVGLPFEAFDLPSMAGTADLPPTLVVHDRRDSEVAFSHGRDIARAWTGARLSVTHGLGHRRLLQDGGVLADVAGFVTADTGHRRSA
jgi:predicted alpha/beta hydrolase family esterase